jgi:hypothetical protein
MVLSVQRRVGFDSAFRFTNSTVEPQSTRQFAVFHDGFPPAHALS